jgi:hypothetical protein
MDRKQWLLLGVFIVAIGFAMVAYNIWLRDPYGS